MLPFTFPVLSFLKSSIFLFFKVELGAISTSFSPFFFFYKDELAFIVPSPPFLEKEVRIFFFVSHQSPSPGVSVMEAFLQPPPPLSVRPTFFLPPFPPCV